MFIKKKLIFAQPITDLEIRNEIEIKCPGGIEGIKVLALWDTGCNYCAITEDIALRLKLKSIGTATSKHGTGTHHSKMYKVDLNLNGVKIINVLVSDMPAVDEVKLFIGMDVMSLGDFRIYKGAATFYLKPKIFNLV